MYSYRPSTRATTLLSIWQRNSTKQQCIPIIIISSSTIFNGPFVDIALELALDFSNNCYIFKGWVHFKFCLDMSLFLEMKSFISTFSSHVDMIFTPYWFLFQVIILQLFQLLNLRDCYEIWYTGSTDGWRVTFMSLWPSSPTLMVTVLLVIFTPEERRSQMRKKCKPICLPQWRTNRTALTIYWLKVRIGRLYKIVIRFILFFRIKKKV